MKILAVFFGLATGFICSGPSPAADFNGDGTNDIGIFRPASGLWAIRNITRAYFGSSVDTPLPGDYNGNGKSEIAIFRDASGLWAIRNLTRIYFGGSGDDPLPAGGASAPWGRSGSNVYYTQGNVGIGTSAPVYPLHIKGTGSGPSWLMGIHNSGYALNDNGLVVRADAGDPFWVQISGGTSALRIDNEGEVGIGVDDPAYALDVVGDIRATGSVRYGGTAGTSNGTQYTKPDYVLKKGYRAMETDEVEAYLKKEKHLPWITAVEDEEAGSIDMTRMSFETVETAENLQLQVITLNKLIKAQQQQIESQNKRIKVLENLKLYED